MTSGSIPQNFLVKHWNCKLRIPRNYSDTKVDFINIPDINMRKNNPYDEGVFQSW